MNSEELIEKINKGVTNIEEILRRDLTQIEHLLFYNAFNLGFNTEHKKDEIKDNYKYSKLSAYQLGLTDDVEAIPYIIKYLKNGSYNDKKLAASAINKLYDSFPEECDEAVVYLINNLRIVDAPQVRQYSLIALRNFNLCVDKKIYEFLKHISIFDDKDYNRITAIKVLRNTTCLPD